MDEDRFFTELDRRFYELKVWFQNNGYMKPIGNQPSSRNINEIKVIKYEVGKKPCQRCGGKITWDNYNKETHPYPDHLDEDGEIIPSGCPEYKPKV